MTLLIRSTSSALHDVMPSRTPFPSHTWSLLHTHTIPLLPSRLSPGDTAGRVGVGTRFSRAFRNNGGPRAVGRATGLGPTEKHVCSLHLPAFLRHTVLPLLPARDCHASRARCGASTAVQDTEEKTLTRENGSDNIYLVVAVVMMRVILFCLFLCVFVALCLCVYVFVCVCV